MRHCSSIVALLFLAPITGFSLWSDVPGTEPDTSGHSSRLTTFQQIPSPTFGIVNAIARDARGFLWFGTSKGICRYDGYQVRAIINPAPQSNTIVAMMNWGSDGLLLASDRGLWVFRTRTEDFVPLSTDSLIMQCRPRAIVLGRDSALWIGTSDNGLIRFRPSDGSVKRLRIDDGLSDNVITSLALNYEGKVWVGTVAGGLDLLDPASFAVRRYRFSPGDESSLWTDHIASLCEARDGTLWIGTDDGLNAIDGRTGRMRRIQLPSSNQRAVMSIVEVPTSMRESGRPMLWVGVSEVGLFSYDGSRFTRFDAYADVIRSLASVKSLFPDPVVTTGTNVLLWVGTRYGVDKIQSFQNPFRNYIRDEELRGLNRGAVISMCEDHAGTLWLGLWGGGLEELKSVNGRYEHTGHFSASGRGSQAIPNNDVNSLLEDHMGNLWIGTAGGLAMFDPDRRKMKIFRHVRGDSTSLPSDVVHQIYEDREGALWICTPAGLSRCSAAARGRFTQYRLRSPIAHPDAVPEVSDIAEDKGANYWITTYGDGIVRLAPDGSVKWFCDLSDSAGKTVNWMYGLCKDHSGKYWLSTGGGLVEFDPDSGVFRAADIPEIRDGHIFGVVEDGKHTLWLSTGRGLMRYDPVSRSTTVFDEHYGIFMKELFSDFARSREGWLMVGGIDGFTVFFPEDVGAAGRVPEIALTSFSVFGREVPAKVLASGGIVLPHDQNFFTLSFAALDFINPQRNRFAYRMVGVDDHWTDAGTRNYATYTHLDPGTYVLRVKGCNSDNVWNNAGISVAITITPPYWATWWFRLLIGAVLAAAMYAVYTYRLRKALEVERLRLRIAGDLHDDVGSNLSTIAMVSRSAQRDAQLSDATRKKLSEIFDTALRTAEGMKDIVWFIQPGNDTLDDLLLRMKDTASSMCDSTGYEFKTSVADPSLRISVEFKRNFFLAFKEILANIGKHTSATHVSVVVEQRSQMLEATVQDNGDGFDASGLHSRRSGNGLRNLQLRAQNIGGVCEIISSPARGTTVHFSGRL